MKDKRVNLFVVGAMRAGTTFFMQLLSRHSDIYVSPVKEPHYFVDNLPTSLFESLPFLNIDRYFEKEFPKPLHRAQIKKAEDYAKLFSLGQNSMYRVEGSISYLHAPEAALNICQYNPDAKIIILLRDPLERAFSHYKMDLGLLRENRSFESLLKEQITDYRKGSLDWSSVLGMSFYDKPIKRFSDRFGDNVLCLSAEALFRDTAKTLSKVSGFLGTVKFDAIELEPVNSSKRIKFRKLFYALNKLGLKRFFSFVLPSGLKQKWFNSISTRSDKDMQLSEKTLEQLQKIFGEESSYYKKSFSSNKNP